MPPATSSATPTAAQQAASVRQQDQQATSLILANATDRIQQIGGSFAVYPNSQPVLQIPPINIGIVKRFILMITGTIANTGTTTITLSDSGLANILSNVQYTDLNGYLRINTTGLHLTHLANAKRRGAFGATYQANTPTGNNLPQILNTPLAYWPVFQAPATIASGQTGTFKVYYEIPLAYSDNNLKGAIYAATVQAIQQLQITFNSAVVSAAPQDDTFSVYTGAAGSAGSITQATVVAYQNYLDTLPVGANGNVTLPLMSLSTAYLLLNTPFVGIPQGQDYPISYANERQFLSTFLTYNSTGASGGRTLGTDLNYLGIQIANGLFVTKVDPYTQTLLSREDLGLDLPAGTYYFNTRKKPIATTRFGNTQLVINPSVASAASKAQFMVEMFALLNTLVSGASIAVS